MNYGTTAPDLAAWIDARRDPAYKQTRPKISTITGAGTKRGLRGGGKDMEFHTLVRDYKYGVLEAVDLRTLTTPATDLAAFIAAKSSPKWKAKTAPARRSTGLRPMTENARNIETRRIARYVASRKAAA